MAEALILYIAMVLPSLYGSLKCGREAIALWNDVLELQDRKETRRLGLRQDGASESTAADDNCNAARGWPGEANTQSGRKQRKEPQGPSSSRTGRRVGA